MNRQPSLKLAIGQAVELDQTGKTGFIRARDYDGMYSVRWDDGFIDTLEHESYLVILPDER